MLYKIIDGIANGIFPRVSAYRALGETVRELHKDAMQDTSLQDSSKTFLHCQSQKPDFRSYWEVPAQYCLIHVDVFGEDQFSQKAIEAVAEVGRVFQWLKAADDLVDRGKTSREESLYYLNDLLDRTKNPKSELETFIVEEYGRIHPRGREYLPQVYVAELRQCTNKDKTRYLWRGISGALLGKLQYALLKEFLPSLPSRTEEFFSFNGIAAAYFDDLKDFSLDRANNQGYSTDMRSRLFFGFLSNTLQSLQLLRPDERAKHFSFLILGGLYQLREFMQIQERT